MAKLLRAVLSDVYSYSVSKAVNNALIDDKVATFVLFIASLKWLRHVIENGSYYKGAHLSQCCILKVLHVVYFISVQIL